MEIFEHQLIILQDLPDALQVLEALGGNGILSSSQNLWSLSCTQDLRSISLETGSGEGEPLDSGLASAWDR